MMFKDAKLTEHYQQLFGFPWFDNLRDQYRYGFGTEEYLSRVMEIQVGT